MSWEILIQQQLKEASKSNKIHSELKKLVKLLLNGSTRFNMVYSSSRDQYMTVIFREPIKSDTALLLAQNGYKQFLLKHLT